MSQLDLRLQFRRLATSMAADSAVAAGTGHSSTTGELRELVVARFLRPHLPAHVQVRSGVIVDREGTTSAQQDCVLVDSRFPVISVGSDRHALLIAESVLATVEIKSYLSTAELKSTMEAIRRTKSLRRTGVAKYTKGPLSLKSQLPPPILPYIFAFEGSSLNTLAAEAFAHANALEDETSVPEAICVLDAGLILRTPSMPKLNRQGALSAPFFQPTEIQTEHLAKDSLLGFYRRLLDDVAPLKLVEYDIEPYFSGLELE